MVIKFESVFSPATVRFVRGCQSRKSALQIAAEVVGEWKKSIDPKILFEKLFDREELGSTVLEDSQVSIPHCRLNGCSAPVGAILRFDPTVVFGNDGAVSLSFVVVVPIEEHVTHLEILSGLANICVSNTRLHYLMAATSPQELYNRFIQSAREISNQ